MRDILKKIGNGLETTWAHLDQRADQKLGFISAPLFGTLLGGGIPAWLVSRLIAGAIALLALWYVAGKYETAVIAERDREWQERLVREVEAAEKTWREKAQRTQEEITRVHSAWQSAHSELDKYSDALEKVLQAERKETEELRTKCAVSAKAVDVLRAKVRRINGKRPST